MDADQAVTDAIAALTPEQRAEWRQNLWYLRPPGISDDEFDRMIYCSWLYSWLLEAFGLAERRLKEHDY